ncbi:MAG: hypothetical protein ACOY3P_20170 [Planctomycetota bacterium]
MRTRKPIELPTLWLPGHIRRHYGGYGHLGCTCCDTFQDCPTCKSGTSPRQEIGLTMSGWANGTCGDCASLDGDYVMQGMPSSDLYTLGIVSGLSWGFWFSSPNCIWVYQFPVPVCAVNAIICEVVKSVANGGIIITFAGDGYIADSPPPGCVLSGQQDRLWSHVHTVTGDHVDCNASYNLAGAKNIYSWWRDAGCANRCDDTSVATTVDFNP